MLFVKDYMNLSSKMDDLGRDDAVCRVVFENNAELSLI